MCNRVTRLQIGMKGNPPGTRRCPGCVGVGRIVGLAPVLAVTCPICLGGRVPEGNGPVVYFRGRRNRQGVKLAKMLRRQMGLEPGYAPLVRQMVCPVLRLMPLAGAC